MFRRGWKHAGHLTQQHATAAPAPDQAERIETVDTMSASAAAENGLQHGPPSPRPRTVLVFGTFDLFHVGHLQFLQRAKALGDRLVVGVNADPLKTAAGKGRSPHKKAPTVNQHDRMSIVNAISCVDEVFVQDTGYCNNEEHFQRYKPDVWAMGDETFKEGWRKQQEYSVRRLGVDTPAPEMVLLPRTAGVSSTKLKHDVAAAFAAPVCNTASAPTEHDL